MIWRRRCLPTRGRGRCSSASRGMFFFFSTTGVVAGALPGRGRRSQRVACVAGSCACLRPSVDHVQYGIAAVSLESFPSKRFVNVRSSETRGECKTAPLHYGSHAFLLFSFVLSLKGLCFSVNCPHFLVSGACGGGRERRRQRRSGH